MTDYHDVRDALCKLREGAYGNVGMSANGQRLLTDSAAFSLAPIFVRALRAAYDKGYDVEMDEPVYDPASGITAGVEAMVEKS